MKNFTAQEEERRSRIHSKDEGGDQRTPYQRDRDRLLHSPALRRLANVTQVVNPSEGRFYHNRLTHTLKVAQIARRLAEHLLSTPEHEEIANRLGGLNADVVEAAALAHDLGHPPFGHIGEVQLNRCLKELYVSDGYEGNAQSFRIINTLEIWRPNIWGLDLTRATTNATLKYPWTKTKDESSLAIMNDKWGSYHGEKEFLDWARKIDPHYRKDNSHTKMSLEARIMDWSDDIAYATHDLEDFYRAGLIPLDRLFRGVMADSNGELDEFITTVTKWKEGEGIERNMVEHIFEHFIGSLPLTPYKGNRHQQGVIRNFTSELIDRHVKNTKLNESAIEDPNEDVLSIPYDLYTEVKVLKSLTKYYVINSRSLATQQYGQMRIIKELFNCYYEATQNHAHSNLLPPEFKDVVDYEREKVPGQSIEQVNARVVADVIASMTDEEAINMHQRLTGMNSGSFMDRLP